MIIFVECTFLFYYIFLIIGILFKICIFQNVCSACPCYVYFKVYVYFLGFHAAKLLIIARLGPTKFLKATSASTLQLFQKFLYLSNFCFSCISSLLCSSCKKFQKIATLKIHIFFIDTRVRQKEIINNCILPPASIQTINFTHSQIISYNFDSSNAIL